MIYYCSYYISNDGRDMMSIYKDIKCYQIYKNIFKSLQIIKIHEDFIIHFNKGIDKRVEYYNIEINKFLNL